MQRFLLRWVVEVQGGMAGLPIRVGLSDQGLLGLQGWRAVLLHHRHKDCRPRSISLDVLQKPAF